MTDLYRTGAIHVVPEPAALACFGFATCAFLWLHRNRFGSRVVNRPSST
jgi:PEP-CTERM motif-containing protein